MKSHYRKIPASVIARLPGDTEYRKLASIPSVRVGSTGAGQAIVHALCADGPGLPGTYLGDTLADLTPATRKRVTPHRIAGHPTTRGGES